MKSKFAKRVHDRIKPEERALMIKSLEILSQIHEILERKGISQKLLAENLNISQAAVSKMLSAGENMGINTITRLELFLGESIITTPKKIKETEKSKTKELPVGNYIGENYKEITFIRGESGLYIHNPLMVRSEN